MPNAATPVARRDGGTKTRPISARRYQVAVTGWGKPPHRPARRSGGGRNDEACLRQKPFAGGRNAECVWQAAMGSRPLAASKSRWWEANAGTTPCGIQGEDEMSKPGCVKQSFTPGVGTPTCLASSLEGWLMPTSDCDNKSRWWKRRKPEYTPCGNAGEKEESQ